MGLDLELGAWGLRFGALNILYLTKTSRSVKSTIMHPIPSDLGS